MGGVIIIVDKNVFFREVTIRICSSLEINTSLDQVFEYMREYIPLNQLFLGISDVSLGAVRTIALATDGSIKVPKAIVFPPKDVWQWGLNRREPFIISVSDPDPCIRSFAKFIKKEGVSSLLLPLSVEDNRIGHLSFRANGEGRYTPDHLELLAVLAKPFAIALANALEHQEVLKQRNLLIDDNRFLNKEILSYVGEEIIGLNSGLHNVMEMAKMVAPLNTTVLLLGETGTGKEVIANAIHLASQRKEGPLIKINCGAIAENLVDDELFGHEKGAFTGAVAEKRGRFERASGGTFFLDEIGELSLQNQVRLLRVLQSKKISRVGGDKPINVDVRIIAATNRDLKQMVSEKKFREDLWFRLNVFPITIPPLRQRREDIPALVSHFVTQKSHELGIGPPPPIALGALERLLDYYWPGNVRELENLVERELIWHRGEQLRFDFLLPSDRGSETVPAPKEPASIPEEPVGGPLSLDDVISLHIRKVLKMTNGKINGPGGAAELLGIVPNTLRGRMHRLGIKHGKQKS